LFCWVELILSVKLQNNLRLGLSYMRLERSLVKAVCNFFIQNMDVVRCLFKISLRNSRKNV